MHCPNCRAQFVVCGQCHRLVEPKNMIPVRGQDPVCSTCAAEMVGSRRKDYTVKTGAPRGT